jgi:hypothetical protein
MADDDKKDVRQYVIHSGVRKRSTRLQRQQRKAGTRPKFVQRFGGTEVTIRRARPARVTEEALLRHLEALKKAEAEGRIEVRTPDGRRVDLNTLQATGPVQVSPPLPRPLLDSAERDIPTGGHMRPQHGTPAVTEDAALPAVLQDELPEGWVDGLEDEEDEPVPVEEPTPKPGKQPDKKPKKK